MKTMVSALTGDENAVIQIPTLSKQIENAQKRCEENNFQRRKFVINYDDVMNKQRQLIYSQRNEVLDGKDVHEQIIKYIEPLAYEIVDSFVDFSKGDETTIDYANFNATLENRLLAKGTNLITPELCAHLKRDMIEDAVYEEAKRQYEEKMKLAEENGINFKATERNVLLNQVDRHWMNQIAAMDELRKGIGLRGYGQKDPVMEYRREGFEMFDEMVEGIQNSTAITLCMVDMNAVIERKNAFTAMAERRRTIVNTEKEPGRNDPCPCGSGRKYKNCCGRGKC